MRSRRVDSTGKVSWKAVAAVLVVVAAAGVLFFVRGPWTRVVAPIWPGPTIGKDLGFSVGAATLSAGGSPVEVFAFDEVVPGGAFDRAGFARGDVLLDYRGSDGGRRFLSAVATARGGAPLAVRIVPGGNGQPLEQRPATELVLILK